MFNSRSIASVDTIQAQIAALQAQLAEASKPQETVSIPFFVHDGSAERPANIPDGVRVIYFHAKDGALCITHSNKRKQWADVKLYITVTDAEFRSFVKSRSKKAI